jgi:hypothetical protein
MPNPEARIIVGLKDLNADEYLVESKTLLSILIV